MILTPGWHPELTNEQHHKLPAISSSALKLFMEDPRLYYTTYVAKIAKPKPYKKEFKIGTCVHMALLEPAQYLERVKCTDATPKTVAYTSLVQAEVKGVDFNDPRNSGGRFYDENAKEFLFITPEELHQINGMVASANKHPLFCKLREHGTPEITGTAPYGGVWLSCRGDIRGVCNQKHYFVDIKTIGSYSDYEISTQIFNFGYYISQLHYLHTGNLIDGENVYQDFLFFFIEKAYPHRCVMKVIEMNRDEENILWGKYFYKLNELRDTIESNDWAKYDKPRVEYVKIPNWVLNG